LIEEKADADDLGVVQPRGKKGFMTNQHCRLAVLLSGSGTTMVNLQEHILKGKVPATIEIVVSSRKKATGLERAEAFGLSTAVLLRKPFVKDGVFDAAAYSEALVSLLEPYKPDLVVMAGFMSRLDTAMTERFDVFNVHPALLPMYGGEGYYGHRVHEAVINAGERVSGATVHLADSRYDRGPIILQEAVPVLEDDTPESLAARVQACERRLYPLAVALYAQGRLKRIGERVYILDKPAQ
jgi:phosphoribosylglycinamide formyltransferase 1